MVVHTILFLWIFVLSLTGFAQSEVGDGLNFKSVFTAQRMKAQSLSFWKEGLPRNSILTGAVLSGALIISQNDTSLKVQEHMVQNKPLGVWAEVGDLSGQLIPNAIYFASYYFYGRSTSNKNSLLKAFHMFESSLYSGLFTTFAKLVAHRQRPDRADHKSYPSGHTTTAFAFAATVGIHHGILPTIGAYSLATLVAASRINDNRHFLHDVVAGAAIGISYSYGIYGAELEKKESREQVFYLTPKSDGSGLALNLAWSF